MLHDFVWFFTTGRFLPDWVQAIAAVVLVILTLVTLAVLSIYAWDTHTLARTSVEQINLVKKENIFETIRRGQAAYDCIFKANDDVISIMQSFVNGTFGTRPQLPIYPQNWPDVTSALIQRKPDMNKPVISFGVSLRAVDLAVGAFFAAPNNDEKTVREKVVREAVGDAARDCKSLIDAMKTIEGQ